MISNLIDCIKVNENVLKMSLDNAERSVLIYKKNREGLSEYERIRLEKLQRENRSRGWN